jgi:membrane associated rhomboid family serine protease
MPEDDDLPDIPLTAVGSYEKFSDAQERGLVAAALDRVYCVRREGREFVLYVDAKAQEEIARELAIFEAERLERADDLARAARPLPKIETLSLFIAAWVMSMFWVAQNYAPRALIERGEADSARIFFNGEWWRTATALTLHGDVSHLAANLVTGLLFAAFVLPQLGTGLTWLGIVLTGVLGNFVNAWFYRNEAHFSIGASTAVFGALGLLVGGEFMERSRHAATRAWWHLVLPLGAGLALLAYLGVGDEHEKRTDYMAHLFGFAAGVALGLPAALARLREHTPRWLQHVAGGLALAALAGAWCRAAQ